MFELKYFLAVAEIENVNEASKKIGVSAGSLSKAINRLEYELQVPLFLKVGRGIKLTAEGKFFQKRALQIVLMEEDTKIELLGRKEGSVNILLSSEEILQSYFGPMIASKIESLFPKANIHFKIRPEEVAIRQVNDSEVHFALITGGPPKNLEHKVIGETTFRSCASKDHPLVKIQKKMREVPIEEVLKYPFVSPDIGVLGKVSSKASYDGWRDDKFPRIIKYKSSGIKLIENLVLSGQALGYLPEYVLGNKEFITLNITGCPYSCEQKIKILCKDPSQLSWQRDIWDLF